MRTDNCRKCGKEPSIAKYCDVCHQAIQFECKICQKLTDEQIHSKCIAKRSKISIAV
ncbi:hypothetical protein BG20_I0652 [Candidatus Nitrosarchaeum limnium BG20]|uniref:Uncharacterized protein n=1 Tax=Candidatus Nitrosarchaeum limnium BG20 TaxID=859192 RepID=S2E9R0_9ARCH|nr:hypothetical protein BG20_I0652 [Candidatus Nitrosarchaeum limnium BG20]